MDTMDIIVKLKIPKKKGNVKFNSTILKKNRKVYLNHHKLKFTVQHRTIPYITVFQCTIPYTVILH